MYNMKYQIFRNTFTLYQFAVAHRMNFHEFDCHIVQA